MKTKTGIRKLKADHVTDYLMNALLPLPDGARLPGVRTIMKKTGAGQLAGCQILQDLRKAGLIRIDPYRGIYRIVPAERSDEIRLLHWQLSELNGSGFVGKLFRKLRECARTENRKLTIENAGIRPPGKLAEELVGSGISRAIVFGAAQPDFARELKNRMRICLELLPRHNEQVVPAMRDAPDMTVRQMDYLFKRGYRRIGYLHYGGNDMYLYPIQMRRLLDYYRLMAENGLRVDPDWVFHCTDWYENLEVGMDRMMNSNPPPEALIAPGTALERLYPWCRKHHLRPGRDLAVFSSDDYNERHAPEPTTITNNPENIAESFWPMFLAAERGERVESRYTELFIRTGQTVPSLILTEKHSSP